MLVRKQGDWLAAKIDEELVLMSAEKGKFVSINDVGTRIWELIEMPQDVGDICAILQKEFAVAPDVCRAEVEAFLNELTGHGVVTLDSAVVA